MIFLLQNFEIDKLKGENKMEKTINNSRIIHKHDTAENWAKAINFIPRQGEIIVYDIDGDNDSEKIKIGDGITNVNDLKFTDQAVWDTLNNSVLDLQGNSFEFNAFESAPMMLHTTVTNSNNPVNSIVVFNNIVEEKDIIPYTDETTETATNIFGNLRTSN